MKKVAPSVLVRDELDRLLQRGAGAGENRYGRGVPKATVSQNAHQRGGSRGPTRLSLPCGGNRPCLPSRFLVLMAMRF